VAPRGKREAHHSQRVNSQLDESACATLGTSPKTGSGKSPPWRLDGQPSMTVQVSSPQHDEDHPHRPPDKMNKGCHH